MISTRNRPTLLIVFIITAFHVGVKAETSRKPQSQADHTIDYANLHTKGFEHNQRTSLLTPEGQKKYDFLVKCAQEGDQQMLPTISLAPRSERKLAYLETLGSYTDLPLKKIPPFPNLSTKEAAAQLAEVYLQALARDVAFNEYGTGTGTDKDDEGSITHRAQRTLHGYGKAYKGPTLTNKKCDAHLLFRPHYEGSQIGPYISQFLYVPISVPAASLPKSLGFSNIPASVFQTTRMQPIPNKRNFGITYRDYCALQNGLIPQPYRKNDFSLAKRYLITGRDLASYVHFDDPFHVIYQALQIFYDYPFNPTGKPLATPSATPSRNSAQTLKKKSFEKIRYQEVLALLNAVSQEVEKAVAAYKWQGQRVLRPEEFANLAHLTKTTGKNSYNISSELFRLQGGVNLLAWVKQANFKAGADTYLLPQAYPEGAPLHPSYPSGHATFSGAYVTILKAIFDDQALFSSLYNPVKPDSKDATKLIPLVNEGEGRMTIGGELNKLAANLAFGRNFAGIHYRADADFGMRLGESVALSFLLDKAHRLVDFKEFELTTFDGKRIKQNVV